MHNVTKLPRRRNDTVLGRFLQIGHAKAIITPRIIATRAIHDELGSPDGEADLPLLNTTMIITGQEAAPDNRLGAHTKKGVDST